ncbi:MAG TPA: class I SAM-dependent methyltransferase [Thermoanaerobaculia bacterium]|nr:class I SAM-dependent methyltransferase [Thermoanaerobaculia bacterium]
MIDVLFALDEPQYHTVRLGESNRFRGAALALSGEPVSSLQIERGDATLLDVPVNRPCPELSFLALPNAGTSRFEFELDVDAAMPVTIRGNGRILFRFDPAEARRPGLCELNARVDALPTPPGAIVAVTQGGDDARSYRNSVVSSFVTSQILLREAGVDPDALRAVLDIGCGTGRLLIGWQNGGRRAVGVDMNAELIAWNKANLGELEWHQSPPLPPLPFAAESFDLLMLASVFTHLPLAWQRAWVVEFQRLLKPGGVVLLTLMGGVYQRTILDPHGRALFEQLGYVEGIGGETGSNAYSTYHSEAFVRELVRPLEIKAMFPSGTSPHRPLSWFPLAAWQDVYVLCKR